MTTLVIAQNVQTAVGQGTLAAVTAAQSIGGDIDVLVTGSGLGDVVQATAAIAGVRTVWTADDASLAQGMPEALADVVLALQQSQNYSHILFAADTVGKAAMPRVAAVLDVTPLSEITAVVNAQTFERFIYAGGVKTTVEVTAPVVVATVRPTAFDLAAATGGQASVQQLSVATSSRAFAFESVETTQSDRPDLLTAKIVVSGGRGLQDEAGFKALEALADKMGAAIGSTRAVVDMGLMHNDTQVGQTGKVVAPELYFAFGISGAIQHVAGMKDSKVIVAVNNDPEAPIFEMVDYYLVGDAVAAVQELTAKL